MGNSVSFGQLSLKSGVIRMEISNRQLMPSVWIRCEVLGLWSHGVGIATELIVDVVKHETTPQGEYTSLKKRRKNHRILEVSEAYESC